MKPPVAKRLPVYRHVHGLPLTDDYSWLKADNWSDCVDDPSLLPPDIKSYLDAENEWCASAMADTQSLQRQLLDEMKGRIQADDVSLPDEEGTWSYVERYQGDDEHSSYWRYARGAVFSESIAEKLIDFNIEAEGHDYFDPGDVEYSPTHTHLAWSAGRSPTEQSLPAQVGFRCSRGRFSLRRDGCAVLLLCMDQFVRKIYFYFIRHE